ncbi:MAG TPA: M20 family metallopeptidase [Candidatus Thermoplasmatota archaeon]|nr:M20 family metallopeptidase [Candidatus Thermoplasmatota archaeon]
MDAPAHLARLIRAGRAGDAAATLALARATLEAAGFETAAVADGNAAVFRRGRSRLLFSGHVDVVPAGEAWTRDPFGGEEADGRVWGRGASDMLGAVACWLALAEARRDLPMTIALTTDEETTMAGAEALLASGRLAGVEAVVVGEPTDFEVGVAEKGVLWLAVEVEGRSAHASMPEQGVNAASGLARAVLALEAMSMKGTHPLLGRPTLSVGRLEAGTKVNVVPERARAEVDIRYLPPRSERDVLAAVRMALVDAGVEAKVTPISSHPPFETASSSALVASCEKALARAHRPMRAVGLPYGTEASRFMRAGWDIVILGPGERALAHTSRESVRLDDLAAASVAYEALAEAWAS